MGIVNSDHPKSEFVLYKVEDDIDPQSKHRIIMTVNLMLNEIKQMKGNFQLESEVKSSERIILGHINEVWILLEELMPKKLKRYGEMSESDEKLIQNPISTLISYSNEILSNVSTVVAR